MIADVLRVAALSTLASSAAIILILLLRKPVRNRFGAQVAYALWALVPLVAVIALLPAPTESVAPLSFVTAAPVAAQALPPTVTAAPSIDPIPWLGAVWLFGIAACAALFLRQQRRFVRALGSLSSGDNRTFRAQTTAGCPALIGAWRPRIVLPADFEQRYDRIERELIVAHERAHMARCDAQLNALAAALRCLNWFNPLFHFAASRFRFDQELACDAAVLTRFPEARRPYADAMLKTQLADLGLPAGCHWQSSHPLKERIAMLKQPLPGRLRRWLGGASVAAIVVATSFAAWAVQPAKVPVADAANRTTLSAQQTPKKDTVSPAQATNFPVSYRRMSPPRYPRNALDRDIQGLVVVAAQVGTDGAVSEAKLNRIIPDSASALEAAALDAVKSWQFNPAVTNGVTVKSQVLIPIRFTINHSGSVEPPASQVPNIPGALDTIEVVATRASHY